MDNLCARARAAMNLLLLICILQAWVLSESYSPVFSDVRILGDVLEMTGVEGTAREFLAEFENTSHGGNLWDPSGVRLSTIRKITDVDLNASCRSERAFYSHLAPNEAAAYREHVKKLCDQANEAVGRLRASIEHAADRLSKAEPLIADLEQLSKKEFEIPFVHDKLDAPRAYWILAFGSGAVLLALSSLVNSIWLVRSADKGEIDEPIVLDLLFLHPSKLAFCLGSLWVFIPFALVAGAYARGGFGTQLGQAGTLIHILFGVFLLVIASSLIRRAVFIRRTLGYGWPNSAAAWQIVRRKTMASLNHLRKRWPKS
jgi:hypothetical protein